MNAKKVKVDLMFNEYKLDGDYEDYMSIDNDKEFQKRTGIFKYVIKDISASSDSSNNISE